MKEPGMKAVAAEPQVDCAQSFIFYVFPQELHMSRGGGFQSPSIQAWFVQANPGDNLGNLRQLVKTIWTMNKFAEPSVLKQHHVNYIIASSTDVAHCLLLGSVLIVWQGK